MAYHRKCKVCGARISLREMPHGGGVAFDVGSDEPHEHGVAGRKSSKAVVLKKNTSKIAKINQTLSGDQIVDRQGNIYSLSNLPDHALDLTPFNLRRFFQAAIDNELSVWIDYRDREDNISSREIHPKSFQDHNSTISDKLKLVAYCRLRQSARTFSLRQITEVTIGSVISQKEYDYENVESDNEYSWDEREPYKSQPSEPMYESSPKSEPKSDYAFLFWFVIGFIVLLSLA